jgi:hypothetical protein
MSRKFALIGAALFTAIVAAVLLTFSFFGEARANAQPSIPATAPVVDDVSDQQVSEFEAALAAREAALREQITQRQDAITSLDETYENQFAALKKQLQETNSQLSLASEQVETLREDAEHIQAEITAADEVFEEEMIGLQNGLTYKDAQLRQEIETVYAQLQAAYDQIAAQEAQAAGSGGDHDGDHDHDDHDDDDHDDHDDDDHEDHEDHDDHDDHDDD